MKAAGITLSTVGAGGGANPFLAAARQPRRRPLLRRGEPASHPRHLPQGDRAGRRPADHRGAVLPDPDERRRRSSAASTQGFPQLLGYNGTTAKSAAQTVLVSARDDPLLAQWQYGLGRSVAWTSDSTGRWAKNWVGWAGLLEVLQPARRLDVPGRGDGRHRGRRSRRSTARPGCTSRCVESDGSPRDFYTTSAVLVGPALEPVEADLDQVAPGVYETRSRRDRVGRLRGPDHPDPARRVAARADRRARRAGRRRVPAPRRERAVPGDAPRGDRRPRDPDRRWSRGGTTSRRPRRSPSSGRGC